MSSLEDMQIGKWTRAKSVRSEATSVAEYLDELPDDRRGDLEVVRESMLAAVPSGVVETMNWGMVSYEIPLERYPDTYNGQHEQRRVVLVTGTRGPVHGTGIGSMGGKLPHFPVDRTFEG